MGIQTDRSAHERVYRQSKAVEAMIAFGESVSVRCSGIVGNKETILTPQLEASVRETVIKNVKQMLPVGSTVRATICKMPSSPAYHEATFSGLDGKECRAVLDRPAALCIMAAAMGTRPRNGNRDNASPIEAALLQDALLHLFQSLADVTGEPKLEPLDEVDDQTTRQDSVSLVLDIKREDDPGGSLHLELPLNAAQDPLEQFDLLATTLRFQCMLPAGRRDLASLNALRVGDTISLAQSSICKVVLGRQPVCEGELRTTGERRHILPSIRRPQHGGSTKRLQRKSTS